MELDELRDKLPQRSFEILKRALAYSRGLRVKSMEVCQQYLSAAEIDEREVCLIVTGSVGRDEALEASDFDVIPILKTSAALQAYKPHDQKLRAALQERLKVKVSQGEDLTKALSMEELISQKSIGGVDDASSALTKRMLILTEGALAGGSFPLTEVRKSLLGAYADQLTTSGRNILSLCNDLARYYRTLCIEYKAKVDTESKDWCTRNAKLRHSRKFWYFSTAITIVEVAERHLYDTPAYSKSLCAALDMPPYIRIAEAARSSSPSLVSQALERYAFFLEFMSRPERRAALANVEHKDRHTVAVENPFTVVKLNSDLLHEALLSIVESLPHPMRRRFMDWFLL